MIIYQAWRHRQLPEDDVFYLLCRNDKIHDLHETQWSPLKNYERGSSIVRRVVTPTITATCVDEVCGVL